MIRAIRDASPGKRHAMGQTAFLITGTLLPLTPNLVFMPLLLPIPFILYSRYSCFILTFLTFAVFSVLVLQVLFAQSVLKIKSTF